MNSIPWSCQPSRYAPRWLQYTCKRQAYLEGAANFVEIELLRGGYLRPLPPIPIPLAPPDPDLSLALQPLVEAVYARSRYDRDIDYRRPLDPPLNLAEATWLEERLRRQSDSGPDGVSS